MSRQAHSTNTNTQRKRSRWRALSFCTSAWSRCAALFFCSRRCAFIVLALPMITAIPAALWGAVIWEIPVTGRKYATGYGVIPWLIAELHIGGLEGWSLTHRFDPFGLVVLPFPIVGIGFAALSILRWYIKWGDRTGRCQNCAYHVQTSAARCPECGACSSARSRTTEPNSSVASHLVCIVFHRAGAACLDNTDCALACREHHHDLREGSSGRSMGVACRRDDDYGIRLHQCDMPV